MNPKTLKRLEDAQDACTRIGTFLKGIPRSAFLDSEIHRAAVERQLEIIGEALGIASQTDPALVEAIPDLPRIVALRNRLIHGYDSVDAELVWDLVQTQLPQLQKQLQNTLESHS
jgi:uncharacterized protein with HEPN domain